MKRGYTATILIVLISYMAFAQQAPGAQPGSQPGAQPSTSATLEPWHTEELPLPLKDVLRFAIVTTGSVPFTLFFVNETGDFKRWFENGFDQRYTPWPFKNQYSYRLTENEEWESITFAVCGSIVLGAVDFVINRLILHSGE